VGEGDAGREAAIEEALENGREIEPPLREDEDQALGRPQPRDDIVDARGVIRLVEIAAPLGFGQARIEAFAVEIEEIDLMSSGDKCFLRNLCHRRSKTILQRMGEHQQNAHQNRLPCFGGTAAASAGLALRFFEDGEPVGDGVAASSPVTAPIRPSANSIEMAAPAVSAAASETGRSSSSRTTA
jgi:hypothetical protein